MKTPEHLCRDLLAHDLPAGFEDAVLSQTLRAARVRRHIRHTTRAAAALAITAIALFLFLPRTRIDAPVVASSPRPASSLDRIRTATAVARATTAPNALPRISTAPLTAAKIKTTPLALASVQTQPAAITTVRTGDLLEPTFLPITDQQLLNLFQGQAVALLRPAPGEAQLIFPHDPATPPASHN